MVRIRPDVPDEAIEDAIRQVTRPHSPSVIVNNRSFHRMVTDGVDVSWRRHSQGRHGKVWLIERDPARHRGYFAVQHAVVFFLRRFGTVVVKTGSEPHLPGWGLLPAGRRSLDAGRSRGPFRGLRQPRAVRLLAGRSPRLRSASHGARGCAVSDSPAYRRIARTMAKAGTKIKELARELGVTSRELVDRCRAEGVFVQNSITKLDTETERRVRGWFEREDPAPAEG